MRPLTKREQNILIICIVLVFSYVGYNGVYKPTSERIQYLDERALTLQQQLKKSQMTISRSDLVGRKYADIIKRFKQSRSNEQEMSAILSEIENAAKQLNLQIADLKPQRVKSDEDFNWFSISLTISSGLDNIVQFLYAVQNEPYFFNVEEIRFDKGAQRGVEDLKTSLVLSRFLIP